MRQRHEHAQDLGGRPESGQGVEGGQRENHLGLGSRVLKHPLRRGQRADGRSDEVPAMLGEADAIAVDSAAAGITRQIDEARQHLTR